MPNIQAINTLQTLYQQSPQSFPEESVDSLQTVSQSLGVPFQRNQEAGDFNLLNTVENLVAGFAEGFTTLPIAKWTGLEQHNSADKIAQKIGELAGFIGFIPGFGTLGKIGASSIGKAVGLSGLERLFGDSAVNLLGHAAAGLGRKSLSVPMLGSELFMKGLEKSGVTAAMDASKYLSKSTLIGDMVRGGLELGAASAVSAAPIYDFSGTSLFQERFPAFAQGGIFGGTMRFIGNTFGRGGKFDIGESLFPNPNAEGKIAPSLLKKQNIANGVMRAITSSLVMGVPASSSKQPLEMQVYEYLMGAYFGYNEMPKAVRQAGEIINEHQKTNFFNNAQLADPENHIKGFDKLDKDVQKELKIQGEVMFGGVMNHGEQTYTKAGLTVNNSIEEAKQKLMQQVKDGKIDGGDFMDALNFAQYQKKVEQKKADGVEVPKAEEEAAKEMKTKIANDGQKVALAKKVSEVMNSVIEENGNDEIIKKFVTENEELYGGDNGVDKRFQTPFLDLAQKMSLVQDDPSAENLFNNERKILDIAKQYFGKEVKPNIAENLKNTDTIPVSETNSPKAINTMPKEVIRQKSIARRDLKENPDKVYLFGDNLEQRGLGGQAKAMRGESNAIGIPTKKKPTNNTDAFFTDKELEQNKKAIDKAFAKIPKGKTIVIPKDGLGTGRAKLQEKAPKTFEYLQGKLRDLETKQMPPASSTGVTEQVTEQPIEHKVTERSFSDNYENFKKDIKDKLKVDIAPETEKQIRNIYVKVSQAEPRLEVSLKWDGTVSPPYKVKPNGSKVFPAVGTRPELSKVVGTIFEMKNFENGEETIPIYEAIDKGKTDFEKILTNGYKQGLVPIVGRKANSNLLFSRPLMNQQEANKMLEHLSDYETLMKYYDAGVERWNGDGNIYNHMFANNLERQRRYNGFDSFKQMEDVLAKNPKDKRYLLDPVADNKRAQVGNDRSPRLDPAFMQKGLGINNFKFVILNNLPDNNKEIQDGSYYYKIRNKKGQIEKIPYDNHKDGGVFIRSDIFDAMAKYFGLKGTDGFIKGVQARSGEDSPERIFIGKDGLHRASTEQDKFMQENDIHAFHFQSTAKARGLRDINSFEYKDGKYNIPDMKSYELPWDNFSGIMDSHTEVNKPTHWMKQVLTLIDDPEVQDKFLQDTVIPKVEGNAKGKAHIDYFNKNNELPKDFNIDNIGKKDLVKIFKSGKGELWKEAVKEILHIKDGVIQEDFIGDVVDNELLASSEEMKASRDLVQRLLNVGELEPFVLRLPRVRDYADASLKNYVIRELTSPKSKYANKFTVAPHSEDISDRLGGIKKGYWYADNGLADQKIGRLNGQDITLKESWDNKDKPEYKKLLNHLVSKSPADSKAGVRVLDFGGFTGKENAMSIQLHPADMQAMAGSDNDGDGFHFYFDAPDYVKDFYKKNENMMVNKDGTIIQSKTSDWMLTDAEKLIPFDPLSVIAANKYAFDGNQMLGRGLNTVNLLKIMYNKHNSEGVKSFTGLTRKGKVRYRATWKPNALRELELAGMDVVNYSADAADLASNGKRIKDWKDLQADLYDRLFTITDKKGKVISAKETKTFENRNFEEITYNIFNPKANKEFKGLSELNKIAKGKDYNGKRYSFNDMIKLSSELPQDYPNLYPKIFNEIGKFDIPDETINTWLGDRTNFEFFVEKLRQAINKNSNLKGFKNLSELAGLSELKVFGRRSFYKDGELTGSKSIYQGRIESYLRNKYHTDLENASKSEMTDANQYVSQLAMQDIYDFGSALFTISRANQLLKFPNRPEIIKKIKDMQLAVYKFKKIDSELNKKSNKKKDIGDKREQLNNEIESYYSKLESPAEKRYFEALLVQSNRPTFALLNGGLHFLNSKQLTADLVTKLKDSIAKSKELGAIKPKDKNAIKEQKDRLSQLETEQDNLEAEIKARNKELLASSMNGRFLDNPVVSDATLGGLKQSIGKLVEYTNENSILDKVEYKTRTADEVLNQVEEAVSKETKQPEKIAKTQVEADHVLRPILERHEAVKELKPTGDSRLDNIRQDMTDFLVKHPQLIKNLDGYYAKFSQMVNGNARSLTDATLPDIEAFMRYMKDVNKIKPDGYQLKKMHYAMMPENFDKKFAPYDNGIKYTPTSIWINGKRITAKMAIPLTIPGKIHDMHQFMQLQLDNNANKLEQEVFDNSPSSKILNRIDINAGDDLYTLAWRTREKDLGTKSAKNDLEPNTAVVSPSDKKGIQTVGSEKKMPSAPVSAQSEANEDFYTRKYNEAKKVFDEKYANSKFNLDLGDGQRPYTAQEIVDIFQKDMSNMAIKNLRDKILADKAFDKHIKPHIKDGYIDADKFISKLIGNSLQNKEVPYLGIRGIEFLNHQLQMQLLPYGEGVIADIKDFNRRIKVLKEKKAAVVVDRDGLPILDDKGNPKPKYPIMHLKDPYGIIDPDKKLSMALFAENGYTPHIGISNKEMKGRLNEIIEKAKKDKDGKSALNAISTLLSRYGESNLSDVSALDLLSDLEKRAANREINSDKIGFNSRVSNLLSRDLDNPSETYQTKLKSWLSYEKNLNRNYWNKLSALSADALVRRFVNETKAGKNDVGIKNVKPWEMFFRDYTRQILGFPATYPKDVVNDKQYKLKGNPYYWLTEQKAIDIADKIDGFLGNGKTPKVIRDELIKRKIWNLSNLEAKVSLLTLLTSPKTSLINLGTAHANTNISVGWKYWRMANDARALQAVNPKWTSVKEAEKSVVEVGALESFMSNEGQIHSRFGSGKNKRAVEKIIAAIKKNPDIHDKTLSQIAKEEGVYDALMESGAWFMRSTERIARRRAWLAHMFKARAILDASNATYDWNDPWIVEFATKGVTATQFLYNNVNRPAFARTALGKIASRFQLFAINSVKWRKESYQQAKYYGFEGSDSANRWARMAAMDMFVLSLATMLPYSIFNSALPPPYSYLSDFASFLFGDKKERSSAFFGTLPYPANIVQPVLPPSSRFVTAPLSAMLSGDWDNFLSYHVWTWFPYGRILHDGKRAIENPMLFPERMFGIPFATAIRKNSSVEKK